MEAGGDDLEVGGEIGRARDGGKEERGCASESGNGRKQHGSWKRAELGG